MKKFLCYDTNDAALGKINVSTNGMLNPNSTVPSTNGAVNQYLVTDGDGNVKWEDRLAYVKGRNTLLVINFTWTNNSYRIELEDIATQFQNICNNYSEVMVTIEGQDLLMTTNQGGGGYQLMYNDDAIIRNYTGGMHPYSIWLESLSSIGIDMNSLGDQVAVTLYSKEYEVKQIDKKFLPDTTVKVNVTADKDNETYSADKTYDEVKALIDSGVDVKCVVNGILVFDYMFKNGNSFCFESKSLAFDVWAVLVFNPNGIVIPVNSPLAEVILPRVSTSDNNKFLQVVEGSWEASSDLIIPSSTSGSTKNFKITVDDSGAITATEV